MVKIYLLCRIDPARWGSWLVLLSHSKKTAGSTLGLVCAVPLATLFSSHNPKHTLGSFHPERRPRYTISSLQDNIDCGKFEKNLAGFVLILTIPFYL